MQIVISGICTCNGEETRSRNGICDLTLHRKESFAIQRSSLLFVLGTVYDAPGTATISSPFGNTT